MKPTQEQVIAWAREAGIKRCDCDPRCHLQTGGIGCITALVTIAYEAGRKDENEACAKVAESYEPRCDSCPSGVANAIRARMTPLQRLNKAAEDNGEEL